MQSFSEDSCLYVVRGNNLFRSEGVKGLSPCFIPSSRMVAKVTVMIRASIASVWEPRFKFMAKKEGGLLEVDEDRVATGYGARALLQCDTAEVVAFQLACKGVYYRNDNGLRVCRFLRIEFGTEKGQKYQI